MRNHLVLVLLLTIAKCFECQYQVTDMVASDKTLNSIDITWTNPVNTNYDKITLDYTRVDVSISGTQSFTDKTTNTFSLSGLSPGETIKFVFTTFLGSTQLATPVEFNNVNELDSVKAITSVVSTEDSVRLTFPLPTGFYDTIYAECYTESANLGSTSVTIPKGQNFLEFNYITTGSNVLVEIYVTKSQEYYSNPLEYFTQTKLDQATWSYKDDTSKKVSVKFNELSAYAYSLEMAIQLISTRGLTYFVNPSLVPSSCSLNFVYPKYFVNQSEINDLVPIDNLCPFSVYNITVTTNRDGFQSVARSDQYTTTYENVDCQKSNLTNVGSNFTYTWPNSSMILDTYEIKITNSNGSVVMFQKTVKAPTNFVTLSNLSYNTEYSFEITSKYKNFTTLMCQVLLSTGDPCSSYDEKKELSKITAPEVDKIQILVPLDVFTYKNQIKNLTILVSDQAVSCSSLTQKNCYFSTTIDLDEFNNQTEDLSVSVPAIGVCYNNKSCTNLKFVLDQNLYFTLVADTVCGSINTVYLLINVPSPFPLGLVVGVSVGSMLAVLIILLTIIIILTFRHIKKKHEEELLLLSKKLIGESGTNNDLLHTTF